MMNFDAPQIEPVAVEPPRPLWSVMIPTYNCAGYLRQTLASVLVQAPGPEKMQIEVIDDCSTKDNPEAVVRELGQGRVAFFRKEQNGGAVANFNTCIQRSTGHLVHILHGDDSVLPGFYEQMERTADEKPNLALFAFRCFFVDEEGVILSVSQRLPELEVGANKVESFFYSTPIQTPSVVVRRSFYERMGGFVPTLVHTADCEMWARAISVGGGMVLKDVMANYRVFAANDSGRLARMAENLRDYERLHLIFASRYSGFDKNRAQLRVTNLAQQQMERFAEIGDVAAAELNRQYWNTHASLRLRFGKVMRRLLQVAGITPGN